MGQHDLIGSFPQSPGKLCGKAEFFAVLCLPCILLATTRTIFFFNPFLDYCMNTLQLTWALQILSPQFPSVSSPGFEPDVLDMLYMQDTN